MKRDINLTASSQHLQFERQGKKLIYPEFPLALLSGVEETTVDFRVLVNEGVVRLKSLKLHFLK